jgi:hypothetical protein
VEISINLLPQTASRKDKSVLYLIPGLGLASLIAVAGFSAYSYMDTKKSIETYSESIASQTSVRDQLVVEYQGKNAGVTEFNFTSKYQLLSQSLNTMYVNTIEMHKNIAALLPDKAEVNAYTYSNSGDLLATISFYSKGDSALFLHRLLNAEFVERAEVDMIAADEEELTYKSMFYIKLDTLAGEKND